MAAGNRVTTVQKFHRGDLVRIAKDLGAEMAHFESDQDALVIGSYADRYPDMAGEREHHIYTLLFTESGGECSWYYEDQLTLIAHAGDEAIAKVQADREQLRQKRSALPWIVANWNPAQMPGESLQALADLCGLGSLWGPSGEGIAYWENSMRLLAAFTPAMVAGIDAVRAKAAEIRAAVALRKETGGTIQ